MLLLCVSLFSCSNDVFDESTGVRKKNGHEYVDLGLSVKWATCNIGSETPEGIGYKYAWGETQPKNTYNWGNYLYCNGSENSQNKYVTGRYYDKVDNKTILEKKDDAAYVNWGKGWRMPTYEEIKELEEECMWSWITINGIEGYKVTGPSGYSIFLPSDGRYAYDGRYRTGALGYWSSSLCQDQYYSDCAYYMYFWSSGYSIGEYRYDIRRCTGLRVRAVTE